MLFKTKDEDTWESLHCGVPIPERLSFTGDSLGVSVGIVLRFCPEVLLFLPTVCHVFTSENKQARWQELRNINDEVYVLNLRNSMVSL